jgi:hypothetical protein
MVRVIADLFEDGAALESKEICTEFAAEDLKVTSTCNVIPVALKFRFTWWRHSAYSPLTQLLASSLSLSTGGILSCDR